MAVPQIKTYINAKNCWVPKNRENIRQDMFFLSVDDGLQENLPYKDVENIDDVHIPEANVAEGMVLI